MGMPFPRRKVRDLDRQLVVPASSCTVTLRTEKRCVSIIALRRDKMRRVDKATVNQKPVSVQTLTENYPKMPIA